MSSADLIDHLDQAESRTLSLGAIGAWVAQSCGRGAGQRFPIAQVVVAMTHDGNRAFEAEGGTGGAVIIPLPLTACAARAINPCSRSSS